MTECAHKNIVNMAHTNGFPPDTQNMTNRMCMRCYQHWYGPEGSVKEYTREEWDAQFVNFDWR